MSDRIKVTPEQLREQSARLSSLSKQVDSIYDKANRALTLMDDALEGKFTSNMHIKARNLLTSVRTLSTSLYEGSQVADRAASAYVDADSILVKLSEESTVLKSSAQLQKSIPQMVEKPAEVDIGDYSCKVSHSEYAKLCDLWYTASKAKDPRAKFIELINTHLPPNDPLRNVAYSQLTSIRSITGFDTLIIGDGDTAIVLFAGTDIKSGGMKTTSDVIADIQLALDKMSAQEAQAIAMVSTLSEKYGKIVVAGHSLGGYLATAVTLKVSGVSECVAFDPPGRYDAHLQEIFNSKRVEKITTYEANGSPISDGLKWASGGRNQNFNTVNLDVESKGNFLNHGISQIHDAMEKSNRFAHMSNTWK